MSFQFSFIRYSNKPLSTSFSEITSGFAYTMVFAIIRQRRIFQLTDRPSVSRLLLAVYEERRVKIKKPRAVVAQ